MTTAVNVRIDKAPTYIVCASGCRSCIGPSENECTECYPPYKIDQKNSQCILNETLAYEDSMGKYQPVGKH